MFWFFTTAGLAIWLYVTRAEALRRLAELEVRLEALEGRLPATSVRTDAGDEQDAVAAEDLAAPRADPQKATPAYPSLEETPTRSSRASAPVRITTPGDAQDAPAADLVAGQAAGKGAGGHGIGTALPQKLRAALAWLAGGNALVRVGALILLVGTVFLLRFVADIGLLPPAVRLAAITLAGVAVVFAGWRLRARSGGYGLVLQGAGIAVIHLCIAAAMHLYALVPGSAALGAMLVLVAITAALAVLQNGLALALFATTTGLLAPIVTSDGGGSLFDLLCFYLVIDLGVLAIAWYRSWRALNWVAFAFTWPIAGLWALEGFGEVALVPAQSLLAALFAVFLAVPILFVRGTRSLNGTTGVLDGSLLFGTPAIAFLIQVQLVDHTRFGVALSAFALGVVYALLARWCMRRRIVDGDLLARSFAALAVVFATLTLPYAFDDSSVTGASWALEGAGLLWLGRRQGRRLAVIGGIGLQMLAGVACVLGDLWGSASGPPFLHASVLSGLMVGIGGIASARFLDEDRERPSAAAMVLLLWAGLFWFGSGFGEMARVLDAPAEWAMDALFVGASALLIRAAAGNAPSMHAAALASVTLLAWPLLVAVRHDPQGNALLETVHSLAWLPALVACLTAQTGARRSANERAALQAFTLILMVLLVAWALAGALQRAAQGQGTWWLVPWMLVPLLAAACVRRPQAKPLLDASRARGVEALALTAWAPLVLTFVAVLAAAAGAFFTGDATPIAYVPVLNPLELSQLLVVAGMARGITSPLAIPWRALAAALGFLVTSAVVARCAHQFADVRWSIEALFESDLVQMGIALLWTSLACATMVLGARRSERRVWVAGAGLLAIVVLKLFTIDLADTGALPQVISFLGVGALVVVIGYFNPIPPAAGEAP